MFVKLLHLYLSISQVIHVARCFIKDSKNKKIAYNCASLTLGGIFKIQSTILCFI